MDYNSGEFIPDRMLSSDNSYVFKSLPGFEFISGPIVVEDLSAKIVLSEKELRRKLSDEYNRGFQSGNSDALIAKKDIKKDFFPLLANIRSSLTLITAQLEKELIKLSVEIAARVVKHEITIHAEKCLEGQIKTCLEQIGSRVPVLIRLNPDDVGLVKGLVEDSMEFSKMLRDEIKLVEDHNVDRGGCVMELDKGVLRAVISEQLEKLEEILLKEYGK
ncbi:hypothetical protein J7M07_06730 [bacterium]|nr:hypothetical protein [bacterium]